MRNNLRRKQFLHKRTRSIRRLHDERKKWRNTLIYTAEGLTIGSILRQGKQILKEADISNHDNEATWMLCSVLNMNRGELLAKSDMMLNERQICSYGQMLTLRAKRMPLQYILGTENFLGLELTVNPFVLIPRPETEMLAQEVIDIINNKQDAKVLDIGTGSGAIGLSVAYTVSDAVVVCTDISRQAINVARLNARRLELENRVEFLVGDLYDTVIGRKFDIIVSNPPYIPARKIISLQPEVARFEPILALKGGSDGLDFYRKIVDGAMEHLNRDGKILFEVGIKQAESVANIMSRVFTDIEIIKDFNGIERIVKGTLRSIYA